MTEKAAGQDPRQDLELIEAFRKGSRESFDALHRRYAERIYRFIAQILGGDANAKDLTQEVFIKLYRMAPRYNFTGKFSAWLYRMAKNLTLNYIRDNRAMREAVSLDVPADESSSNEIGALLSGGAESDREAISHEAQAAVRAALMRLSPEDRAAIALCDLNEMPHKEAAEVLGCSLTALNVRLFRARIRLAKTLGIKVGALVHPCRFACTGATSGPSLYHLLAVLGKEQVLQRMDRAAGLAG